MNMSMMDKTLFFHNQSKHQAGAREVVEVGWASDKTWAFEGQARDVRLRCRDNIALRFERLGIA